MLLNNILYMYSNMDNSSQILLFLIILVALMLISIFIINTITRKRAEKYEKEFNMIDRYTRINKKEKKKDVKEVKPIKINEPSKKYVFQEEKKEIKKEIPKKVELEEEIEVMEDPEVIEVVSNTESSVDKISMLIEDNMNNPKPINLTEFELEEEKNAIISYDELVKKAGAKKIVYKAEKATINENKKDEKIEIKHESKQGGFKASQVISPIYGIKKDNVVKKEKDEFLDVEKSRENKNKYLDDELTKDFTFLTNLKTFRSNLD